MRDVQKFGSPRYNNKAQKSDIITKITWTTGVLYISFFMGMVSVCFFFVLEEFGHSGQVEPPWMHDASLVV